MEFFTNERLGSCRKIAEQAWVIKQLCDATTEDNDGAKDWRFSFGEMGRFFGCGGKNPGAQFRRWCLSWQDVLDTRGGTARGRKQTLNLEQQGRLWKYVKECDDKMAPLTQVMLLEWLNEEFDLEFSLAGLGGWIKSENTDHKLHLVDSEPLEAARSKLSEEELRKNAKELETKVGVCDARLLLNVDETALDSTRATQKLHVVSTKSCPRAYVAERGENHITFVVGVGIVGWKLTTMVIVPSQTVHQDLAIRYGLPRSEHAHVVSSSSAYINDVLFEYWVDNILIPGVASRRRFLDVPNDAKALVIMDGCTSHQPHILEKLSKHHIDHHILIAHSSHITQPLDRGIFSAHKKIFKSVKSKDTKNKFGNRLMRGLKALEKAATFSNARSSFWRAGLELNYEKEIPRVVMNVETWLTQRNSPDSVDKEEAFMAKQSSTPIRVTTACWGSTQKERAQNQLPKRKRVQQSSGAKNGESHENKKRKVSFSTSDQGLVLKFQVSSQ